MPGVSAILTAAGESRRMGSPKPLLPWRGDTLIRAQIRALLDAPVAEVIVVLGHKAQAIAPTLADLDTNRVHCVTNPAYLQGKTTSIKAGLRAASPDAHAILLLAVDQPRPPALIRAVIDAHNAGGALITSPRHRGHGGHPLIFAAALRPELALITEDNQGIRQVFQAHRRAVRELPIDDPIIRLDLNTPDAYRQALPLHGIPPSPEARAAPMRYNSIQNPTGSAL